MHGGLDRQEGFLTQLLNMGAAMISCGADINLVEESLARMGKAYGARDMNVLAITSSVVVTMRDSAGQERTQTRRIHTAMATDFDKLEKLNALCRRCCDELLAPAEIERALARIGSEGVSRAYLYVGSVLAAGSFAVFFGGSVADGAVAAIFALVVCLLVKHVKPYCPNEIVFNFVASLVSGFGICAAVRLVPALQADKIIIGVIMLLIPGIAITNAMRDMLAGDTIAGTLRLVESLLWAGAIALGFMVAIWAVGV